MGVWEYGSESTSYTFTIHTLTLSHSHTFFKSQYHLFNLFPVGHDN
jgi:hypothetical protein